MTCKDCIGYKFCSRGRNGLTTFYGKENACDNVEDLCQNFKSNADFVEVVRCKDCEYLDQHNVNYAFCEKTGDVLYASKVDIPQHFCGYGKRINQ